MKSYSITILPDSIRGKHISLTIRGPLLIWLIAGIALTIGMLAAAIYYFIIVPYESVQNKSEFARQLAKDNSQFEQRIESARNHMDVIDGKLQSQLQITDKLYFIFGVTDVGGGGYSVSSDDPYVVMLDTLEIIEKRYERLENYLYTFDELPIRMPLKAELRMTSNFGPRRSPFTTGVEMHRGVDLAAPQGTPVYAAGAGVVEMAGRWQTYDASDYSRLGEFVLIRHGDTGYETIYGHCSKVLVRKGDEIKPGQLIARVGNTGWSTGPHLHFAIIHKNKFVDPKLYLLHFDSGRFLEEILVHQEQDEGVENVRIE